MNNKLLLEGKRGIIFGALNEKSIAWKVAEKAYESGAQITLTNTPLAIRMGELQTLGDKCKAPVISADATNPDDIKKVITQSMEYFGGKIDFILHSIGMSPNIRKNIDYDKTNYNNFFKTLDVSALSFHKILQVAKQQDAINHGGSIVALTYIASQRTMHGYNDMADAKSLLESISRSFGYIYGKEKGVRINTVSQSPTKTTAGEGIEGIDKMIEYSDKMSPLGNASADECADMCITLFSDLTRKITMQNIFNDGGFSSMSMSDEAMRMCKTDEEKNAS